MTVGLYAVDRALALCQQVYGGETGGEQARFLEVGLTRLCPFGLQVPA